MVDKNDKAHPKLIEQWSTFVNGNLEDGEKWTWIIEHYDEYDKPDSSENQLYWLKEIRFRDFRITIKDRHWTHFKAKK